MKFLYKIVRIIPIKSQRLDREDICRRSPQPGSEKKLGCVHLRSTTSVVKFTRPKNTQNISDKRTRK